MLHASAWQACTCDLLCPSLLLPRASCACCCCCRYHHDFWPVPVQAMQDLLFGMANTLQVRRLSCVAVAG